MSRRKLTEKEHRMWMRVAKSIRAMPKEEPKAENIAPQLPSDPPEPEQSDKPERPHARTHATSDDLEKLIGGFASPRKAAETRANLTKQKNMSGLPADRVHERRVRRGRVPFGSTLDLHGHTQISGRAELIKFVAWHRSQGETSVLVITGKGRDGEGILRRRFLEWIAEPDLRVHVSGYSRANQKHGGDGAFYLFLKKV
jgi:DNA-nicking Smr family endonuclease